MTKCLDSPFRDPSLNYTASKSSGLSQGSLFHIECLDLKVTVKPRSHHAAPVGIELVPLTYNTDPDSQHIEIETGLLWGSGDLEFIFK